MNDSKNIKEKYSAIDAAREIKKKIKSEKFECPICHNKEFSILQQFATIPVSDTFGEFQISKVIPAAIVMCLRCGNIQFFSLVTLGIPEKKNEPEGV